MSNQSKLNGKHQETKTQEHICPPAYLSEKDVFAHFDLFLETVQLLDLYPFGKSLSYDLLSFIQEESQRRSR
ncbi:hypothetical protein PT276_08025 [Orbaceae bacterium ESL0721]|nr:hypothetical protein [Orbaceae bacterium ESL0721]